MCLQRLLVEISREQMVAVAVPRGCIFTSKTTKQLYTLLGAGDAYVVFVSGNGL